MSYSCNNTNDFTDFSCNVRNMIMPFEIRIKQYTKIFYVCLLIKRDKLVRVIFEYLEDHFMIQFLLIRIKDYKVQLPSI